MSFATGNGLRAVFVQRYLGIDPGLNRTGYTVLERTPRGPRIVEAGLIRSTQSLSLAERVHEIGSGLREVFEEHQPEAMAIEEVFSHAGHPKTAILMGHARGVILYTAADFGVPILHYAARQIKKLLTGSGRASKEQIQQSIVRELSLDKPLEPNDVADACAIALCHYHSVRLDASQVRSGPDLQAS